MGKTKRSRKGRNLENASASAVAEFVEPPVMDSSASSPDSSSDSKKPKGRQRSKIKWPNSHDNSENVSESKTSKPSTPEANNISEVALEKSEKAEKEQQEAVDAEEVHCCCPPGDQDCQFNAALRSAADTKNNAPEDIASGGPPTNSMEGASINKNGSNSAPSGSKSRGNSGSTVGKGDKKGKMVHEKFWTEFEGRFKMVHELYIVTKSNIGIITDILNALAPFKNLLKEEQIEVCKTCKQQVDEFTQLEKGINFTDFEQCLNDTYAVLQKRYGKLRGRRKNPKKHETLAEKLDSQALLDKSEATLMAWKEKANTLDRIYKTVTILKNEIIRMMYDIDTRATSTGFRQNFLTSRLTRGLPDEKLAGLECPVGTAYPCLRRWMTMEDFRLAQNADGLDTLKQKYLEDALYEAIQSEIIAAAANQENTTTANKTEEQLRKEAVQQYEYIMKHFDVGGKFELGGINSVDDLAELFKKKCLSSCDVKNITTADQDESKESSCVPNASSAEQLHCESSSNCSFHSESESDACTQEKIKVNILRSAVAKRMKEIQATSVSNADTDEDSSHQVALASSPEQSQSDISSESSVHESCMNAEEKVNANALRSFLKKFNENKDTSIPLSKEAHDEVLEILFNREKNKQIDIQRQLSQRILECPCPDHICNKNKLKKEEENNPKGCCNNLLPSLSKNDDHTDPKPYSLEVDQANLTSSTIEIDCESKSQNEVSGVLDISNASVCHQVAVYRKAYRVTAGMRKYKRCLYAKQPNMIVSMKKEHIINSLRQRVNKKRISLQNKQQAVWVTAKGKLRISEAEVKKLDKLDATTNKKEYDDMSYWQHDGEDILIESDAYPVCSQEQRKPHRKIQEAHKLEAGERKIQRRNGNKFSGIHALLPSVAGISSATDEKINAMTKIFLEKNSLVAFLDSNVSSEGWSAPEKLMLLMIQLDEVYEESKVKNRLMGKYFNTDCFTSCKAAIEDWFSNPNDDKKEAHAKEEMIRFRKIVLLINLIVRHKLCISALMHCRLSQQKKNVQKEIIDVVGKVGQALKELGNLDKKALQGMMNFYVQDEVPSDFYQVPKVVNPPKGTWFGMEDRRSRLRVGGVKINREEEESLGFRGVTGLNSRDKNLIANINRPRKGISSRKRSSMSQEGTKSRDADLIQEEMRDIDIDSLSCETSGSMHEDLSSDDDLLLLGSTMDEELYEKKKKRASESEVHIKDMDPSGVVEIAMKL